MWLLWYALRIGLSYEAAMRQPMGRLLDLLAIEQVKREGFRLLDNREYDPTTMDLHDALPGLF